MVTGNTGGYWKTNTTLKNFSKDHWQKWESQVAVVMEMVDKEIGFNVDMNSLR